MKFTVEWDSEEGTLRVRTDPKLRPGLLPVIKDWADLISDMNKVGVGMLERLTRLQRDVFEALAASRVEMPETEEVPEEEIEEETEMPEPEEEAEEEIEEMMEGEAEEEAEESAVTP